MNQMQGGGGRVSCSSASPRPSWSPRTRRRSPSPTSPAATRPSRSSSEIKEFLAGARPSSRPSAPRSPRACCSTARPAPARRCSPAPSPARPACRSTRSPAPTSSRCSSASAPRRVRDLFEQAKENAPAIVFIDEIDAVGRHRGAGMGGGHDEREQTLNQLLVEMDGFDVKRRRHPDRRHQPPRHPRPGAAAPRPLRPPDRASTPPTSTAATQILEVHAKGKPIAPDVDLLVVARRTPGFTGADLANVLNEAALLTARSDQKLIDNDALDEAIDRVIAGPQKRTRHHVRARRSKITAYHEGGHALVAAALHRHRPGAQGHDPAARPGPRLHDGPARPTTSTPRPATRCSTSSPTRSAAASPRRSSSTTPPPAPATTSRRPPAWPARWSPSTA